MTMIVGYGTLLSRHSLGSTIGRHDASTMHYLPVVVPDWRRLYNLRATHYTPSCALGVENLEAAAANVEPAPGCRFNGLMFEADADQLESLDSRERYYRRVEVEVLDFSTQVRLGSGFTYMCPTDSAVLHRNPAALLPHWRDIVLARTGAYQVSEMFGQCWDGTSFLADGSTPVIDRYRDLLDRMATDAPHLE